MDTKWEGLGHICHHMGLLEKGLHQEGSAEAPLQTSTHPREERRGPVVPSIIREQTSPFICPGVTVAPSRDTRRQS